MIRVEWAAELLPGAHTGSYPDRHLTNGHTLRFKAEQRAGVGVDGDVTDLAGQYRFEQRSDGTTPATSSLTTGRACGCPARWRAC